MVGDLAVIAIAVPKTRTRGARVQAVLVEDPLLALLLDHTFGHLPPQALLLPVGLAALRRDFAWALRRLGLAESPYTLASLRGGGRL